ncbi:MAG: TIGR00282 family metallophosphoesterase [Candidatus Sabulitectum sp.]|nr:TIGR00282 family metallophosphoesterase [Candidatus Sabulitectum sp.]
MRILLLGDVVGRPGRNTVFSYMAAIRDRYDFVVINGENAAGGFGITPDIAQALLQAGADVITSGNHIWKKESILPILSDSESVVLRPANYPKSKPGTGFITRDVAGVSVQVINLQGKVFTDFSGDCPFKTVDRILESTSADVRIIDFHAEATSEKLALAHYVDGRVNVFVGTHTHVQTADEQVLPGGTAYLTDLGMCGSSNGVIGMEVRTSIGRFLSDRYSKLVVAQGGEMINGLEVTLDEKFAVSELRRVYEYVPITEERT